MQKITIPLGGEERSIKFTINTIQELEAQLASRNVMSLMHAETWSVTDVVSACHCGLKAYDRTLSRRKVEEWVTEYAVSQEQGIYRLQAYLQAALGMSGLMGGKKSAFEGILTVLGGQKENDEKGKLLPSPSGLTPSNGSSTDH